jgi:hypothetical protein
MRVSVETTSGLERKLTVGVPADDVDSAVDKKLAEAAKNVRLAGFSPWQGAHACHEAALWRRRSPRGAG